MSDLFSNGETGGDTTGHAVPRPSVDVEPGSYIRVPANATDEDLDKVEQAIQAVRLNDRIREDYEALKDDSGRFPNGFRAAREKLAEKYAVSEARVRRAVSGA